METNEVHCPQCGSTQITANKKGFSGGKAVAGVVLTGGIGLLAGTIGSNKVTITCLNCGNQFKPGQGKKSIPKNEPKLIWNEEQKKHIINPTYGTPLNKTNPMAGVIFIIVVAIIAIFLIRACN